MKNLMLTIVVIMIFIINVKSQSPDGVWKGTCYWNGQTSNLTINFVHAGGTIFKGAGIERSKNRVITFTCDLYINPFDGSGIIRKNGVTNIVLNDSGKITKTNNVDDFEKKPEWPSNCLCDDNKRVIFAYDNKYNYFETECYDQLVYWSLAQTKLNNKSINPEQDDRENKIECLYDNVEPVTIDTVFISSSLPFEVRIIDFDQNDGDLITIFSNNKLLIKNREINNTNPIIIPASIENGVINLTWCSVSTGNLGRNTGEIYFIQNNVVLKEKHLNLARGERARFVILPMAEMITLRPH